ncbi:fibrinogen and fibronectin [Reticulomyxa filosa]|uniref:Fibrinogen and fibronectin n=1 Tax=Reticulomyxa filosa TaxID=46433 RepID=X6LEA5_RETFI|nr:fibrinogen and fibronectin [Reticulomyxa filosa]|eukprot:ETO00333.1 fibrinogen and fibronectin [Reticulomyxa filosa]
MTCLNIILGKDINVRKYCIVNTTQRSTIECYRQLLYQSQTVSNDKVLINAMESAPLEEFICSMCGLEDITQHFLLACDCQKITHMNCPCHPNLLATVPSTLFDPSEKIALDDYHLAWFCPICVEYSHNDMPILMKRRQAILQSFDDAFFEVEEIMDYDKESDQYLIKWRNYPHTANNWRHADPGFYDAIIAYWKTWVFEHPDTLPPSKAKAIIEKLQGSSKTPLFFYFSDIKKSKRMMTNPSQNQNQDQSQNQSQNQVQSQNQNQNQKQRDQKQVYIGILTIYQYPKE